MMARRWILAETPAGPIEARHFSLQTVELGEPRDGDVLVEVSHHTLAPGLLAQISASTFAGALRPGDAVPGPAIGRVVASRSPRLAEGDAVYGYLGWSSHVLLPADQLERLDPALYADIPIETALGALGISGLTAYVGLFHIAAIAPSDTLLVSSGAGWVGSFVGQMARGTGCEVVGIAGSPQKCDEMREVLGYDRTINYRAEEDLAAAIRRECPKGVDLFFDNVGGKTLAAGVDCLNNFGRVAICGRIADHADGAATVSGLSPSRRLTLRSFLVFDHSDLFPEARSEIASWLRAGTVQQSAEIVDGLERSAEAFVSQFGPNAPSRPLVRIA